ncbi:heparan-alpha-glucosaminide N-acetyltransferase domain-containing protein [Allorhizocola rhizosphaerae]|uniref:heparan-alpha-glucosaminide N-acetyltransferase domain-containing protein n=1 Tax=Allorhizocola rhizosphaerae TaxID=1872709 RepID=UPI000E3EB7C4|nr:heparan-alpha-glucosaminide N-acetyltransferase domain-containing protein [Allorhizocola rhizosphaerae]
MNRLIGVDAARGAALLGVIAVHSLYEANRDGTPTWSFSLFGGRSAALFAVLAGLGVAFLTGGRRIPLSEGKGTVAGLAARALAIGGIGLALGYTDAGLGAVILPHLAVMLLLAIPLVFLPGWVIAATGALTAIGMPVLVHLLQPHLPKPKLRNPTLRYIVDDPLRLLYELCFTGEYPALPWMAYLCAGLAIGRLDLTRRLVTTTLAGAGVVLAVAASVTSSFLTERYAMARIWAAQPRSDLTGRETAELLALGGDGTTPTNTWWWLAIDAPHTGTPFDLLGTTGVAMAVLGLMLLAAQATRWAGVIQTPLAAAGSMTLTLYVVHIMFINSEYDVFEATTGCLVQIVAALVIGLAWRATVGRGPLETLTGALASRARRWATSERAVIAGTPATGDR